MVVHYKVLLIAPKWPGSPGLLSRLVPAQLRPVPLRADLLSQAEGLSVRLPIGIAVSSETSAFALSSDFLMQK